MTIKIGLTSGHFGDGVRVFVVNDLGHGERRILRNPGHRSFESWETLPEAAEVEPTLALDDDTARALLDALTRHYHGAEDTRALRRDYDAERQRVDAQAQVIADVARTLAAGRIGGAL